MCTLALFSHAWSRMQIDRQTGKQTYEIKMKVYQLSLQSEVTRPGGMQASYKLNAQTMIQ